MSNKLLPMFAKSGKKSGLTFQMATEIRKQVDKGEVCHIAALKYPESLVRILNELGQDVVAEPCYTQPPFQIEYDEWSEPTGQVTWPEKKLTGYTIKLKNSQQ